MTVSLVEPSPAAVQAVSRRPVVLIAHPAPDQLREVRAALGREFAIELAQDGATALKALAAGRHSAAIVHTALPALSGLEVLHRLAALQLARRPHVVAIGAKGDPRLRVIGMHKLADAVQTVPCPAAVVLRLIWRLLDRGLEQRWARLEPRQQAMLGATRGLLAQAAQAVGGKGELNPSEIALAGRTLVETLAAGLLEEILASLRSYHDYTYAHSVRVATHLAMFALATGMRREDAELLAQAGLLHDIGKTAVPVPILDKPGPLDDGEWPVMHRHPLAAATVLRHTPALPAHLIHIAERHHERLDGTGYPHGLVGVQIDEPSLLCAIADVHTALTDRRPYKNPLDDAAAFAVMRKLVGSHLEPGLFHAYEAVMRDCGRG
jgi:putative nucleotidyltransferase with HDIG domain